MKPFLSSEFSLTPASLDENWPTSLEVRAKATLTYEKTRFQFLQLHWELKLSETQPNTIWLFALDNGELFRLTLHYNPTLKSIIGDLRRRIGEQKWCLMAVLRSTTSPEEKEVDVKTNSPFCELVWLGMTAQKDDPSVHQKLSDIIEATSKEEPVISKKKVSREIRFMFGEIGLENYVEKFEELGIEIDDLKTLIPDIGKRVKLVRYLAEGRN